MTRNLALLLAGAVLAWIILAVPARLLWGDEMLLFAGVAAALAVIPVGLGILVVGYVGRTSPDHKLYAVMAVSVGKMFLVLLAGLLLYQFVEPFEARNAFLYWLLLFYLLALVYEKALWLRERQLEKNRATAPSGT